VYKGLTLAAQERHLLVVSRVSQGRGCWGLSHLGETLLLYGLGCWELGAQDAVEGCIRWGGFPQFPQVNEAS